MAISIRILKCMIPGAMCQVSERAKGPHGVLTQCFKVGRASRARAQGVSECGWKVSLLTHPSPILHDAGS